MKTLLAFTALVLAPLAALYAADQSTPSRKPNIIVIFSDDHGWADLGCQGPASGDWQEVRAELPAKGQIIHLRVLLPGGATDIGRISLSSKNSDATKQWVFDGK